MSTRSLLAGVALCAAVQILATVVDAATAPMTFELRRIVLALMPFGNNLIICELRRRFGRTIFRCGIWV
jgi:hypothetical protein